jgi:hypothetical protein
VAQDDGRFLLFRLISPGSSILTHVAISMLGIGISVIGSSFVGCTVASRKCSIGWVIKIIHRFSFLMLMYCFGIL